MTRLLLTAAILAVAWVAVWFAWGGLLYAEPDLDDLTWDDSPMIVRGAVLFEKVDGEWIEVATWEPTEDFDDVWTEFDLAELGILGGPDGDRD